jgi:hypothetical protein
MDVIDVNESDIPVVVKAKRGRKPKPKVDEPVELNKVVSKRVRKGKIVSNVYDASNNNNGIHNGDTNSDDEHVIVKLNIPSCIPDSPRGYNAGSQYSAIRNNHSDDNVSEPPPEDETQNRVIDLLKDFEEKNKNNEWPQTTSISCYWCCHKFQTTPFGLPVKYSGDKFHVIGCFCSLECSLAYNYDMNDTVDAIWERANLVSYIGKKIGIDYKILPAPPKLSLNIFGGHLSIEDFRDFCKTSKLININFPPMMTLRQQIEEINESDIFESKFIPVDNDRIAKFKDNLILKRSKPVNKTGTTLDHTMNLRFGKEHKDS